MPPPLDTVKGAAREMALWIGEEATVLLTNRSPSDAYVYPLTGARS